MVESVGGEGEPALHESSQEEPAPEDGAGVGSSPDGIDALGLLSVPRSNQIDADSRSGAQEKCSTAASILIVGACRLGEPDCIRL